VVCGVLIYGGFEWRALQEAAAPPVNQTLPVDTGTRPTMHHPLIEFLKLVAAAMIGMLVSAVHQRYHGEKPLPKSLQQAQVLLCVAGAMIMIIIGNNLARAFGVAGAAGIVRFRTPVEDPKDTTVIFLQLSLGLACGLGAFAVAGLGTLFLCVFLVMLDRFGEAKRRSVLLSMTAPTKEFPAEQVNRVLAASVDFFEQREVVQGAEAVMRYQVTMDPNTSLTYLTGELVKAGLKSVAWGEPGDKKKDKGA
jgi:uncharacterized membrane protein YhiD involved in acid resistance